MRQAILAIIMLACGSYLYFRYKRYYHKIDFGEIVEKSQLGSDTRIPFVVKNKLGRFKNWTIDFFRKNYGNELIYVLNSENKECTVSDSRLLKMQLGEYIDEYIRGKHPHKKKYYFRSEDYYKFLQDVGLDRAVEEEFKGQIPWYLFLTYSFWMGPEGSTTTFHYDTDATNFLCVLEGRKRVLFVHPKGEDDITPLGTPFGDFYTVFDPEDEDRISRMKREGNLSEIVVEKGDILNIPRNIWHAVVNLEDSVAFTFHYETLESVLCQAIGRFMRRAR